MHTKHFAALVATLIFLHAARALAAGDPWLEQCHGLPTFKAWSVEPATYGSANIVYEFSSHCGGTESTLFGHDDVMIGIKGRWNYGTKQAFEYITYTDYHLDQSNHESTYQATVSLLYYCGTEDPWANSIKGQCKVAYCTASRSNLCGVKNHYAHFPITYDRVPGKAANAAYNAFVGPLVVTNPTSGELLAPGFPVSGDVRVELRGHAPVTPDHVTLSFELNSAGWAEHFPAVGAPLHTPLSAARIPGQGAAGVSAVYKAPLTADSFKVTPTKLVTGEWRVKACAEGLAQPYEQGAERLCSHWVKFNVAATAPYKIPPTVFREGLELEKPKNLDLRRRRLAKPNLDQ